MSKGTDGGRGKSETAKTRLPRGGKAGVAAFERGLTRAREKVGFKQVIESCNLAELQPSPSREDFLAEREKLAPLLPADRPQPAPDARKVVIRKLEVREAGYRGPETARPTKEQIARARAIGYDIAAPEAPESKGQGLVDNYEKPSYKRGMDGLTDYLKSRGVPESLQPKLAAKLDAWVTAEITGRTAAPKLSEADLAAFMAHAAANQWNPESKPKVSPSAFIKETFKGWLGRGLTRKNIFDAQENLAGAYSTEVSRDPSKRVEGLITARETLPVGAPRPASIRPVAELSETEKTEKRQRDAAKMRRWRQSQREISL